MADSDSDEDLKKAIALSLQDQHVLSRVPPSVREENPPYGVESINLESEDDAQPNHMMVRDQYSRTNATVETPNFLGLNRRSMEQERLARKRRISISPPPTRKAVKTSSPLPVTDVNLKPNQQLSTPKLEECGVRLNGTNSTTSNLAAVGPTFLDGVVKKTWAYGHEREDDIKIEEVLQSTDLKLAVLSSFQWDIEWLLGKLKRSTLLIFVMQAKEDSTKRQYERETSTMPNLRLCFPPMIGQVHCMHSKLMLLSYASYLRIVIPTANLVPYDWGETGVMENMVFLIDLPRLPADQDSARKNLTMFGQDLIYFLEAMGLDQKVIESIHKFDFSRTQNLAFVHTIGGAHSGTQEPWRRTGYCGLGRAIEKLGLKTSKALSIDFITSSVGSLNMGFLSALYLAAQGDDGLTEYGWRSSSGTVKKAGNVQAIKDKTQAQINESFHIYFPTRETVASSTGGTSSGGTICFQSKWYNSLSFPRGLLRDCRSLRKGLLMHNKLLFVRESSRDERQPSTSLAWTYVGSANCSESAWGRLTKDKTSKAPRLNCRNWECGVLVSLNRTSSTFSSHDEGAGSASGLAMFEGAIPVPMKYPGEDYGNKEPWFPAFQGGE
ncbi:hypothetical protein MMC07_001946 [Pseudocyphellaria aurata]|nr:hypothetical protein [Pseudocyphellaria aurata]